MLSRYPSSRRAAQNVNMKIPRNKTSKSVEVLGTEIPFEVLAIQLGNEVRKVVNSFFEVYRIGGFPAAYDAVYTTGSNKTALKRWWDVNRQKLRVVRGHLEQRVEELYDELHEKTNSEEFGESQGRGLTELERREVLILTSAAMIVGKPGRAYTGLQLLAGVLMADSAIIKFGAVEDKILYSAITLVMHYLQSARGMPAIQLLAADTIARDHLKDAKPIYEMLGIQVGFMDANAPYYEKKIQIERGGILYVSVSTFFAAYLMDRSQHNVFRFKNGQVLPFRMNIDEPDSILFGDQEHLSD